MGISSHAKHLENFYLALYCCSVQRGKPNTEFDADKHEAPNRASYMNRLEYLTLGFIRPTNPAFLLISVHFLSPYIC